MLVKFELTGGLNLQSQHHLGNEAGAIETNPEMNLFKQQCEF